MERAIPRKKRPHGFPKSEAIHNQKNGQPYLSKTPFQNCKLIKKI